MAPLMKTPSLPRLGIMAKARGRKGVKHICSNMPVFSDRQFVFFSSHPPTISSHSPLVLFFLYVSLLSRTHNTSRNICVFSDRLFVCLFDCSIDSVSPNSDLISENWDDNFTFLKLFQAYRNCEYGLKTLL